MLVQWGSANSTIQPAFQLLWFICAAFSVPKAPHEHKAAYAQPMFNTLQGVLFIKVSLFKAIQLLSKAKMLHFSFISLALAPQKIPAHPDVFQISDIDFCDEVSRTLLHHKLLRNHMNVFLAFAQNIFIFQFSWSTRSQVDVHSYISSSHLMQCKLQAGSSLISFYSLLCFVRVWWIRETINSKMSHCIFFACLKVLMSQLKLQKSAKLCYFTCFIILSSLKSNRPLTFGEKKTTYLMCVICQSCNHLFHFKMIIWYKKRPKTIHYDYLFFLVNSWAWLYDIQGTGTLAFFSGHIFIF